MASTTTVTILEQTIFGNKRINMVKFACSNYDVATGIAITAAICGLSILDYAILFFVGTGIVSAGEGPLLLAWDPTNSAIKLNESKGVGLTNATSLIAAAGYVYVLAIGS